VAARERHLAMTVETGVTAKETTIEVAVSAGI
jgi:hypothetical protein